MPVPPASLADRLGRIAAQSNTGATTKLSNAERAALTALEVRERHVRRGAVLIEQGARPTELFILSRGVMASRVCGGADWRRLIRLYLPGDLMTTGALALRESQEMVVALADCIVHPVSRSDLGRVLADHPRLAMLLIVDEQIERAKLTARLVAIETMMPANRVAALLIDLRDRLRAVDPAISTNFMLPLTPDEIGEAVALKPAEAIRALQQLESTGLISREAGRLCLLDENGLQRVAGSGAGRPALELSWLGQQG